jgi:hypothetical protein
MSLLGIRNGFTRSRIEYVDPTDLGQTEEAA